MLRVDESPVDKSDAPPDMTCGNTLRLMSFLVLTKLDICQHTGGFVNTPARISLGIDRNAFNRSLSSTHMSTRAVTGANAARGQSDRRYLARYRSCNGMVTRVMCLGVVQIPGRISLIRSPYWPRTSLPRDADLPEARGNARDVPIAPFRTSRPF